MYELKFVRKNPGLLKEAVRKKREKADIDAILDLDATRRKMLVQVEELKAQRNKESQRIGRLKAEGKDASEAIAAMREVSDRIKEMDERVREIEERIETLLEWVPNIPHESVPEGDETANAVVRTWGEPRMEEGLDDHLAISKRLGLLDMAAASRMSGSGFAAYTGLGARLQRALIDFMIDLHTGTGYTEVRVPYATRAEALFGCGQLPKLREDMYEIEKDDLFLIPTAEVPLTNLYAGRDLKQEDLPIYLVAYSPCFRREAGAHGKQTRGLIRLHQFDKVELVKVVEPETSYDELEKLTADAESVLQALEIPYRVVLLAAGDLSFASAKCYDLEIWAPGERRWLEVSSCSNFEDFQARRIGLRFRSRDGKLRYAHTLNGSGVALPRLTVVLLEHYQRSDGSVEIPKALRPYMGGIEAMAPAGG